MVGVMNMMCICGFLCAEKILWRGVSFLAGVVGMGGYWGLRDGSLQGWEGSAR